MSCSSLLYSSLWCRSSSGYLHIKLKSGNIHASFLVCMCKSTDLLQTHCFGRCPASSSRLWRAGCLSNVAHQSKLQKASVDPAVMRSGLWKNIQESKLQWLWIRSRETKNTSRSLTFPLRLETSAEQTQFIINNSINQSSTIQWSEIRPLESRCHWLPSSPLSLWLCVKELRYVCSSPPAYPSSSASSAPLPPSVQWLYLLLHLGETDEASQTAV